MAGRVAILLVLGLALLHMPLASADNDPASANGLTDGVSSSGYVCDPNGCSPTDKRDYWKTVSYTHLTLPTTPYV